MSVYKDYEIEKNEFGYYEATSLTDCDAKIIHAKTYFKLITEIDDKTLEE